MRIEPVFPKYGSFLSDESRMTGHAECLAFPESAQELQEAIRYAGKIDLRITLQGARTGLSGGAVPQGGVIISLSRMSGLSDCERQGERGRLHAQAGATLEQIERKAAACGFYFPPNPTEKTATIGGMFATAASGMSGFRCGAISVSILAMDWVTPSGDLWHIRRGAYLFSEQGCVLPDGRSLTSEQADEQEETDLIDFLSGNEGRLGAAVSFDLLLQPERKERWGIVFFFRHSAGAVDFIRHLIDWREAHADLLYVVECFNCHALDQIAAKGAQAPQSSLPEFPRDARAAVYMELHGNDEATLDEALESLQELFARSGGADEDTWAECGRNVDRLHAMRHTLVEAFHAEVSPSEDDAMKIDACFFTPGCRSGECLAVYLRVSDEGGIPFILYGHVLEQSMHVAFNPKDAQNRENFIRLLRGLSEEIRLLGGKPAFDYGTGKLSFPWIDPATLERRNMQMRRLALFFDPHGRFGG